MIKGIFRNRSVRITLIIFIIGVAFFAFSRPKENKVYLGNNCFYVELATTPGQHARGLMFRKELARNRGMLFIFDAESKWPFYMKNTFIPLDIIWISKKKEVVFVKKNAQPCLKEICPTIYPDRKALYALEINAGIAEDIGLKIGDKVRFGFR